MAVPSRFVGKVIVCLGLAGAAPVAPAVGSAQVTPDAGQKARAAPVIGRVLEAYGGTEAIRAVHAHRQEGMLVALQQRLHGRLYRVSSGPDRLGILVEYPGRNELRILEDDSAWRGPDAGSLAQVRGPLKGAMVLQAARAWLPRLLDDHRDQTVVSGSRDGRTVLDVRVADDLVLRVFVEDASGLIVRSESILESAPGPVGFATDYSDFRSVDGVVFPFREETFASGVHTGSTVLGLVELNPKGARAKLPVAGGS